MKFAFWIYLALIVAGAAWGVGFLFRSEFTPYHRAAAGVPWSQVPPNLQVVILALTKLAGGLWVAVGLCLLVLLLWPFRQGARWALWAVPLLLLAQLAAPMPAMIHLTTHTSATPPWTLTLVSMAVTLVALVVSVTGKRAGAAP
jgi:hypothetical protein